ncbi:MAG: hypothetical protein IPP94_10670 [Ignavibacteria bacterium]|nr:hypothetical protein [Ignavibacteria bacterium]
MKKLVLNFVIIVGMAFPITASAQTAPTRFQLFGEFLNRQEIWDSTQ